MLKNNISDISYVRTSTSGTSQLSSLGNQTIELNKNPNHGVFITYTGSAGSPFPTEFKNKIFEFYEKNNNIRINIISFDRLTRNFSDLDFINKYITYIYVVDEKKMYDVKNDMEIIIKKVNQAVQELNTMRNRCNRYNKNKKIIYNKNTENAKNNLNKRCKYTTSNLSTRGITDILVEKLKRFIWISQNLNNLEDWKELFNLMDEFGLESDDEKEKYAKYTDKYNKCIQSVNPKKKNRSETQIINIRTIKLSRNDVMEYIVYFINNANCDNYINCDNDIFIKHFVDSHIKQSNIDNESTLPPNTNNLESNISNMHKLQNIINSKK
jgi:hypothetical protein